MRVVVGFFAAVLAAYLVGCLAVSQGNIAAVTAMGFEITLGQRWQTWLHDLTHMVNIYLPLIAIAYLIALPVTAGIIRLTVAKRWVGYVAGGFVALIAIHVTIKLVLGMSGVAPTRTLVGLVMQGVAGAVGGYCYYKVTSFKAVG